MWVMYLTVGARVCPRRRRFCSTARGSRRGNGLRGWHHKTPNTCLIVHQSTPTAAERASTTRDTPTGYTIIPTHERTPTAPTDDMITCRREPNTRRVYPGSLSVPHPQQPHTRANARYLKIHAPTYRLLPGRIARRPLLHLEGEAAASRVRLIFPHRLDAVTKQHQIQGARDALRFQDVTACSGRRGESGTLCTNAGAFANCNVAPDLACMCYLSLPHPPRNRCQRGVAPNIHLSQSSFKHTCTCPKILPPY